MAHAVPPVISEVVINHPANETVQTDREQTVRAEGLVKPNGQGGLEQVVLYLKVYPGKPFATVADVPPPTPADLENPTVPVRPDDRGIWTCDQIGPVHSNGTGADNQLVIWAYNPTGGPIITQLSNFKAQTAARPTVSLARGALGPVGITHPSNTGADNPYPVNNLAGSTTGNITASGTFTGQPNTAIYLIVVSGIPFSGSASMPGQPIPGSKMIRTSGDWICGDVPVASCSSVATYPKNQLLVWATNSDGSYSSTISTFTGKSTN